MVINGNVSNGGFYTEWMIYRCGGGKFSLGRAFWQPPEMRGHWDNGGGVRGLGFCMAVLVWLQYTGTLPTVHGYVLFRNAAAEVGHQWEGGMTLADFGANLHR